MNRANGVYVQIQLHENETLAQDSKPRRVYLEKEVNVGGTDSYLDVFIFIYLIHMETVDLTKMPLHTKEPMNMTLLASPLLNQ